MAAKRCCQTNVHKHSTLPSTRTSSAFNHESACGNPTVNFSVLCTYTFGAPRAEFSGHIFEILRCVKDNTDNTTRGVYSMFASYTACTVVHKGVCSYRALLTKRLELGCLVRRLWIGTGKLDSEELGWGRAATQLRSLACGEHFLAHAINRRLLAKTCGRVTLMVVEKEVQCRAWGIKQVHLCTGVYSTKEKFPDATTLCFNAKRMNLKDEKVKVKYEAMDRWAKHVEAFILVERDTKRASLRGMEARFQVGKRI